MNVSDIVQSRGIQSVLHFTTNRGVLGVLASKSLKARARLNDDEQLRHIFQPNAVNRNKDAAWLDYVNLSVSRINFDFFDSSGHCHRGKDFWWCILSFSPEILSHEGVWFATTNNIYTGVKRGKGADGLEAIFGEKIVRWSSNVVERGGGVGSHLTTCQYAEVLYPGEVPTNFLQCIYVKSDADADELVAQFAAVNHTAIPVNVAPAMFAESM